MDRLRDLLAMILPRNRFYSAKFAGVPLGELTSLPFTTKAELVADQTANPPFGTNLTHPPGRYTRLHQTSGTTTGRPLRWLDTSDEWNRVLAGWTASFPRMGFGRGDRFFFPFSFGPFLGFWSAFEAATRAGIFAVPGGGMSSAVRVRTIADLSITAVFCTPTYALHLAEVAAAEGVDLPSSDVRAVVVAGEPGGSIPATRARIEAAWGARVFDHYGMTETGPVAFEPVETPGVLDVFEEDYLAEVIAPDGTTAVPPGETGELVLTTLGRIGMPLVRYRTGDLVQAAFGPGLRLAGGVLGRADDMLHVRGNNVYPAAVEAVVRRFPAVAEFRIVVENGGPLADLVIEIEPALDCDGPALAIEVGRAVRDVLQFRVEVRAVPPGSLPRFEMKARRVVRRP